MRTRTLGDKPTGVSTVFCFELRFPSAHVGEQPGQVVTRIYDGSGGSSYTRSAEPELASELTGFDILD